jgi:glucose-6-phosphate isomerase
MESLGKRFDRNGRTVSQGLSVFGNKGSTDQHAYVQQLRDGLDNFFCIFIQVLLDQEAQALEVEPGITTGDYLQGFLLGTRDALAQNERESLLISLERVDARAVGVLIALFERTVGFYASMININAYHQPGVEAGKQAASSLLVLQGNILNFIRSNPGTRFSAGQIGQAINANGQLDMVFKVCEHLVMNTRLQGENFHCPNAAIFWK